MSIFANSDAPCGVFGAVVGQDTFAAVSFVRGFRSQNSAGEIETIFRPVATITGDLQPIPAGLTRELHGQVFQVQYNFITMGETILQDGDRAYVRGAQVEVTQIAQYGTQHCEIELGYIGR
jgi:hypothetical protein